MPDTAPTEEKKEAGEEADVVVGSNEVYSIYTDKEKWLIVAMVAIAGFYRYVEEYSMLVTH